MGKIKDLTGMRFGRLTVISISSLRSRGNRIMWNCTCDCTSTTTVTGKDLLNGNTTSCGCYAIEIRGQYNKKYNVFDFNEEIGIGHIEDDVFYFDKEDYDKIKKFYWVIHNGYVATTKSHNGKTNRIYLHRLLLNLYHNDGLMVDHINHNKLDNRKSNIRIVTCSENNMNTKLSIANNSGVIGVSYNKKERVWNVRLQKDKKLLVIERYKNIEDAIIARLAAEKKYYGEFSPQKHLFEKYNI